METRKKIFRIVFIIGIVALIAGMIDPLEGSVVCLAGSFLIALSTLVLKMDFRWIFLACFISLAVGIFFLFYFSSLGGFGDGGTLSWWWIILILPFPIGWLISVVFLIIREVRAKKAVPHEPGKN